MNPPLSDKSQHLATLFRNLLSRMGCDIAGTGNHSGLAINRITLVLEHMFSMK